MKLWKHSLAARAPTEFVFLQIFLSSFFDLMETWNVFLLLTFYGSIMFVWVGIEENIE